MTLKKVLVTYDFTDETYETFLRKEIGMGLFHTLNIARNKYDQSVFGHLQSLGVDVEMLTHAQDADVQKTIQGLKGKLASADLVFHETPRIAFERDGSNWKTAYVAAIEELVHDDFLDKTHFSSRDKMYTDKKNGSRIAAELGLPIPKTWTVDEYFASNRQLPVILKHHQSTCGQYLYFIDKAEQIDRFFNEDLYDPSMGTPDRDSYDVQEFIKTPSNRFTHYRVFTLGDGTIVGAVLSASGNTKDSLVRVAEPGPFRAGSDIYDCVDSPVYMDCLKVVSNHAQGGSQIPFDADRDSKPLTESDREIVSAHGYNPENLTLHSELRKLAGKAARGFSRFGVQYSGQDWMQDPQGNFYFIEINAGPGMGIFNTLHNSGQGDNESATRIGTRKLAEALANYKK